jgi:AcrR family transcriptional regulator
MTAVPSPDEPRGEQTRRLIVHTAVRLFSEQGYDKTTMRAIAQAAGHPARPRPDSSSTGRYR